MPGLSWVHDSPIVMAPNVVAPRETRTRPALESSVGHPQTTSAKPSPSKSPAATAPPQRPPLVNEATTGGRRPPCVNPPEVPKKRWTDPASKRGTAPATRASAGQPITRSAKPSPLASPAPSADPHWSNASTPLEMDPTESCVRKTPLVSLSPLVQPKRTLTAPASKMTPSGPRSSPGQPIARSSRPSPSKSPVASEAPQLSFSSTPPEIPELSWLKVCVTPAASPLADP